MNFYAEDVVQDVFIGVIFSRQIILYLRLQP